MSNDEILVRAGMLERIGIHLGDPYLYNVCSLDGDTFNALLAAICAGQTQFELEWKRGPKLEPGCRVLVPA